VPPRPYRLGQRRAQIDATRRRVLDAARSLLSAATTYAEFTVDAVARQADVARATVYYQFGSKTGLIEALCDDLAAAAGMDGLADAFGEDDPGRAVAGFVAQFGRFWSVDRDVMRRLRAIAALDPEVGAVIAARDERLRHGVEVLLGRVTHPPDALGAVSTLLRFETFDALAGPDRAPSDVVPAVLRLVDAALRP
jgi:AcrR family transcriptional regulator